MEKGGRLEMTKTITVSLSDSQYMVLKLLAGLEGQTPLEFTTDAVEGSLKCFVDMYFYHGNPRREELMEALKH
jgi:hypothetical protein